jgi:hypothetical protein
MLVSKITRESTHTHKIPFEMLEELQVNASKSMQVNRPDLNLNLGYEWTGGDLNTHRRGDVTRIPD